MRYFIDTEFWERPHGPGPSGTIDLISLAIVAEDGRELYLENSAFPWSMVKDCAAIATPTGDTPRWLLEHVYPHLQGNDTAVGRNRMRDAVLEFVAPHHEVAEFWGWYCDYDWVIFCWLFGRMVDLPDHFPVYCHDLKQEVDRRHLLRGHLPAQPPETEHNALVDARWVAAAYKRIQRLDLAPLPVDPPSRVRS